MPPREPLPRAFEDRVAAEFERDMLAVEDRLVAQAGPPPDSERLSDRDDDETWSLRDPNVDYDALAQRLLTQGLSPEEAQALAVVQEHPEWLELYTQATGDAEMADRLARLAEMPFRWKMLMDLEPGEQVKKAERLNRRRPLAPEMHEQPMPMMGA